MLCIASEEQIAEQILKRKKVESLRAQHKNKNLEELITQQKIVLKQRKNIAKFLESKNVPVLQINTSENKYQNASKVLDFIHHINK